MLPLLANADGPIADFLQYGSFGLIAFLIFMFVWQIYPSMQKAHREERVERDKSFTDALTKIVDRAKIDSDRYQESSTKDRDLRYEFKVILDKLVEKLS